MNQPIPIYSTKSITEALSLPFEPREVKFKPQAVKGTRAMALAYVDARVIQDRLDQVLGVEGWQDDYQLLPDGSVSCRLQLFIGDRWISKMDVGSPSEQPDGGDRLKAAFSDALKRAAVKFGIGRYLYRLPAQWVNYDPAKKQFSQPPQLPAFALPPSPSTDSTKPAETKPVPAKPASSSALPNDGEELHRRLRKYDAQLAAQHLCSVGALLSHVAEAGSNEGFGNDITHWSGPAIVFAVDVVKQFELAIRKDKQDAKPEHHHAA